MTDYGSRRKAVTSLRPLLVVRFSNKNVSAQFIKPKIEGDAVLASAHSRDLAKLGWKGSRKSTPACYLLGMLAGRKALEKGVKDAVVYNGVAPFIRGARAAAFVKGVADAGVKVPVGDEALPSEERISGKPIADYASKLSSEDKGEYERRFSMMIRSGFKPEDYPVEFERMKAAIGGAKP
jgi:large subunit ribosomal protein L18